MSMLQKKGQLSQVKYTICSVFLTVFDDILIDFGCKELLIGFLLTNWFFVFCSYTHHLFFFPYST